MFDPNFVQNNILFLYRENIKLSWIVKEILGP